MVVQILLIEYNEEANIDNGTCLNIAVYGCTSDLFIEFDFEANINDGSCQINRLWMYRSAYLSTIGGKY